MEEELGTNPSHIFPDQVGNEHNNHQHNDDFSMANEDSDDDDDESDTEDSDDDDDVSDVNRIDAEENDTQKPTDETWCQFGEYLEEWLSTTTSKSDSLYEAYKNLTQDRDVKYFYHNEHEEKEDEVQYSDWAPYKNGLHFLLHLVYRFDSTHARRMIDDHINIIKSLKPLGLLKPEAYDQIPKNASVIADYDKAVPQLEINFKHLWMTLRKKKMKYKTNKKSKENKKSKNNATHSKIELVYHDEDRKRK